MDYLFAITKVFLSYLRKVFAISKCTPPTIQALCRWRSSESVPIYARMNPRTYADTIVAAIDADVLAISTHNLPQLDHYSAFTDYQASETPTQAPTTFDAGGIAAA